MEYIFRFIEYINESNIISWGLLIFVIAYLTYLYSKKEEIEQYLCWKLAGFYILGAFTFRLNFGAIPIIIPLGFIIYLYNKDKVRKNILIKKKAVIFGVLVLFSGVLNSIVYNKVEYRSREIPMKNISIKTLRNDYEILKNKLNINYTTWVEMIDIDYNENNKIRKLQYTIKDETDNKIYYISGNSKGYSINVNKIYNEDNSFIFNSNNYNMDTEALLDVISNTEFKKYKNTSYYSLIYRNDNNYYEDSNNLYTIDFGSYSIKKLISKYPVYDTVDIMHVPMKQVSEGHWESTNYDVYLLNYNMDEVYYDDSYESEYSDIDLTIENTKTNKTVLIEDKDYIVDISERLKSEIYDISNIEVNINPDLYIKYSDGSTIGLSEDNPGFAMVENNGTKIWYIVSSDLYENLNLYTTK